MRRTSATLQRNKMGKFDGVLICTDLDGTLLRNDKSISCENLEAIDYFCAGGGAFTIVTGRMPFFNTEICDIVKLKTPFGCINGGGVYDYSTKRYLWTQEIDRACLDLAEHVERTLPHIGIQINTFDRIYFCKENKTMEYFRHITHVENLVCGVRDVHEPLAKIVFGIDDGDSVDELIDVLNAHPLSGEFDFIRTEKHLYEIMPKGVNKGTSVSKICEHLGLDVGRSIAIGDYNNDIPMLRAAGVGIAVANACEDALAAADFITVSNEEHAIARVIHDLENGKYF